MKHAKLLLASVFILLVIPLLGWGSVRAAPDNSEWLETPVKRTATPEPDTATPVPDTATPWPTATPWDTPTWVTPTSPPEETREPTPTVGVSPDPSASATPGTDEPDGEATPTLVPTLPVTGGGILDNVKLALIAIGTVVCVFVILLARAGRRVER